MLGKPPHYGRTISIQKFIILEEKCWGTRNAPSFQKGVEGFSAYIPLSRAARSLTQGACTRKVREERVGTQHPSKIGDRKNRGTLSEKGLLSLTREGVEEKYSGGGSCLAKVGHRHPIKRNKCAERLNVEEECRRKEFFQKVRKRTRQGLHSHGKKNGTLRGIGMSSNHVRMDTGEKRPGPHVEGFLVELLCAREERG